MSDRIFSSARPIPFGSARHHRSSTGNSGNQAQSAGLRSEPSLRWGNRPRSLHGPLVLGWDYSAVKFKPEEPRSQLVGLRHCLVCSVPSPQSGSFVPCPAAWRRPQNCPGLWCFDSIQNRFAFTAKGLVLIACAGLWNSVRNHKRVGQCPQLMSRVQWKSPMLMRRGRHLHLRLRCFSRWSLR
jgi:hypothetical protein